MALSADRIITPGQTPHAHERDAFDFVVGELPDTDPYRLWAFVDLIEAGGRRYDIDLLVLGYHALYLVEVKSHVGVLTGDEVDWTVTFPGGGRTTFENPLRATTLKARVLGSLLDRAFPGGRDTKAHGAVRPWVQPLVFLSQDDLEVRLTPAGGMNVVTRRTLREAITRGQFPGATDRLRERFVNRPTAVATQRVLKEKGLRPSVKALKVQDLMLRELLEDGAHYQDHLGVHQSIPGLERRVRSFVVPANTTAERREQLLRAARREAQILTTLSDHKNILRLVDYATEGPLGGPCVILEHVADALPLDVFMRANPDLPFDSRLAIIQQIAEALEFCHRKQVVHRGLSPRAVLVRQTQEGKGGVEARLYNFQVAATETTPGTAHISSLSPDQAAVYTAPEVVENPPSADEVSDLFSLGAVAYHVLTGQPPGTTLAERSALLATGHLSVAAARDGLVGGQTTRPSNEQEADEANHADEERRRVKSFDEVIAFATEVNPHARPDSPIEWLNLLLDAATTPAAATPDAPFASPLDAGPGQHLASDLEVVGVLGSGSTARVLRVRRDGRDYALKVAHTPEMEDRLHHEAKVLRALAGKEGSSRIVSLEGELTLGGRACLLITDAGESLASLIAREGPPSLDFARRWGEDLLQALEALEDSAIQHRDIKPANLGVLPGAAKKKRSLLLFDFSLAGAGEAAVTAGTPVYRDPFVVLRGRWDAAADRWSAAITLHELLTGIRPGWGTGDETAVASHGEIRIAAERFDPSGNVRPRLVAFFKKALAREVAARFASADAMRTEWVACFASASDTDPALDLTNAPAMPSLAGIGLETPIAALPLSARAKNALDRAGLIALGELLRIPRSRFPNTRGIGRRTHQEIQRFVEAARTALGPTLSPPSDPGATLPFFPDFRGDGLIAQVPGLSPDAVAVLEQAGLGSLAAAAAATRAQVERLLGHFQGAASLLRDRLGSATSDPASAAGPPATIDGWLDQLLARVGKRPKYQQTAAQMLGLEDPPGNEPPAGRDARSLARHLGVTQAAVHIAFGKARDAWRQHPYIGELRSHLARALDDLGTVAPLTQVAQELGAALDRREGEAPPAGAPSDGVTSARAAEALARIAAEVSDDLVLGRIHQRLWLARGSLELALARALGDRADELAARSPLGSSDEVRVALRSVVEGTALVGLAHERLVALGAEASATAARSARLELYPRGMEASRALELSVAAIPSQLATPDAIRQIVRARYPKAEALPDDAELHPLMARLGLEWDAVRGVYVRPGAEVLPSKQTQLPSRLDTTHTSHRLPPQLSQEETEFEARLRLAVDKHGFRVLDVSAGQDMQAAGEIERRFRGQVVSLEASMLAEVERLAVEWEIDPAVIEEADRQGPAAPADWENLRRLMRTAAERALKSALSPAVGSRPLVLTQVGLLARYGLDDVLSDLVAHGQRDDAPPIFVVNPTDDGPEWARIDAATQPLMIPIPSPAQRLKVPPGWTQNLHRGAP